VIGTVFQGQNRQSASLTEMPPQLLNALVAKEDERFREHGGVDLWGIMRALWVTSGPARRSRGPAPSPSSTSRTPTSHRTSPSREKVKEALIAIEIERKKGVERTRSSPTT
jgi:penicillin-binding protein 1A